MKFSTLRITFVVLVIALLAPASFGQDQGQGGEQPQRGQEQRGGPEQFIDRLMAGDADGDGKLSKSEVPEGFADRFFDQADTNHDGFLTREELTAMAERFAERQRGGEEAEGQTPDFEGYMGRAGRALRALRRSSFEAATREEDLAAIDRLEIALVGAKSRLDTAPMAAQAKEKYGDDEAAFRKDFRMTLIQAIVESLQLETAIDNGDTDGAKASLERLLDVQREGHDAFQPKRERGQRGRGPRRPDGGGGSPQA